MFRKFRDLLVKQQLVAAISCRSKSGMDLNQLNFDNTALRTLPIDPESGESGKLTETVQLNLHISVAPLQTTMGVI